MPLNTSFKECAGNHWKSYIMLWVFPSPHINMHLTSADCGGTVARWTSAWWKYLQLKTSGNSRQYSWLSLQKNVTKTPPADCYGKLWGKTEGMWKTNGCQNVLVERCWWPGARHSPRYAPRGPQHTGFPASAPQPNLSSPRRLRLRIKGACIPKSARSANPA